MELTERIAGLIAQVVLQSTGREVKVGMQDRIIEMGLLDSLSMVNLVLELQREFDIDIDVADLDENTFGSPTSIARLVAERVRG